MNMKSENQNSKTSDDMDPKKPSYRLSSFSFSRLMWSVRRWVPWKLPKLAWVGLWTAASDKRRLLIF